MSYRVNNKMLSFVSELNYNFKTKLLDLPNEINEIIYSDIVNSNGCILISRLCETAPKGLSDLAKSQYEYSENHFHPDSFADEDVDELGHLKLGLECARSLANRLEKDFLGQRFRIILSFSESITENGDLTFCSSTSLRFYQIRQIGDDVMRLPNLNAFETEAILEIEI